VNCLQYIVPEPTIKRTSAWQRLNRQ